MLRLLILFIIVFISSPLYANDWGEWGSLPGSEDENLEELLPPSLSEALADPAALRVWVLQNPDWAKQWADAIDLDLAPLIGQDAWDTVLNDTVGQLNQQDNVIQPIQPAQPAGPVTIIPPGGN